MNYYTADTHFGHASMSGKNGLSSRKNFKTEVECDNTIIENWNKKVLPEDTVHIIGDVTMNKDFEYLFSVLKKLSGNIVIYLGNHDDSKFIKKLMKNNYLYNGKNKFEIVEVGRKFKINKKVILLTHWPLDIGLRGNYFSVHGHIHEYKSKSWKHLNIGVDSPELERNRPFGTPISETELDKLIENKARKAKVFPSENIPLKNKSNRTKIAYSKFLKSYILLALKLSNKTWFFYKCDKYGKPSSKKILKAGSPFSEFDWKSLG